MLENVDLTKNLGDGLIVWLFFEPQVEGWKWTHSFWMGKPLCGSFLVPQPVVALSLRWWCGLRIRLETFECCQRAQWAKTKAPSELVQYIMISDEKALWTNVSQPQRDFAKNPWVDSCWFWRFQDCHQRWLKAHQQNTVTKTNIYLFYSFLSVFFGMAMGNFGCFSYFSFHFLNFSI